MARPYLTLERVPELSIEQLRREWARHYGAPAPALSVDLLRMGLGYRMQERRFGGLSRYAREVLSAGGERGRHAIRTLVRLTPGTRLVRDWHGVGHNGIYASGDTTYIVYHGYDAADGGKSKLLIQELKWDSEGWPVTDGTGNNPNFHAN